MKYCMTCGKKLPQPAPKFCPNCGADLKAEETARQSQPAQAVPLQQAILQKDGSPQGSPLASFWVKTAVFLLGALFLAFLVFLFFYPAGLFSSSFKLSSSKPPAVVFYNASLDEGGADIVTEVYWPDFSGSSYSLKWHVPEDSQPKVWDETGSLEADRTKDDEITVFVNPPASDLRTRGKSIFISYRTADGLSLNYTPLYRQQLYLNAPNNMTNVITLFHPGFVTADCPGFNRSSSESGQEYRMLGKGDARIRVAFGHPVQAFTHFVSFTPGLDLSEADAAFEVLPMLFGINASIPRLAMIAFDDEKFDELIGHSVGAQSQRPNVVVFRTSDVNRLRFTGDKVMHEVSHVYQGTLYPDLEQYPTVWFREGMADLTAYAAESFLGYPNLEIFGKPRVFNETDFPKYFARVRELDPQSVASKRVIANPRANSTDLWDYYASGKDDFKAWADSKATIDFTSFDYKLSLFAVANIIREHGGDFFHRALVDLSYTKGRTTTIGRHGMTLLDKFQTDLDPCKPEKGAGMPEFEQCIAEVNAVLVDPPLSTHPIIQLPPPSTDFKRPKPVAE